MKKIALVLLGIIVAPLAFAQESWVEDGLSAGKCRWESVQLEFKADEFDGGKAKGVWKPCENKKDVTCLNKFCSGPKIDLPNHYANGGWPKDHCNKYCITLQETLPLEGHEVKSISGDEGADLLSNYFRMWYKFGALLLGMISVLVIVVSGVQIIAGGVSENGVTTAKTRILAAVLSLILLFASAFILKTINPLFFS